MNQESRVAACAQAKSGNLRRSVPMCAPEDPAAVASVAVAVRAEESTATSWDVSSLLAEREVVLAVSGDSSRSSVGAEVLAASPSTGSRPAWPEMVAAAVAPSRSRRVELSPSAPAVAFSFPERVGVDRSLPEDLVAAREVRFCSRRSSSSPTSERSSRPMEEVEAAGIVRDRMVWLAWKVSEGGTTTPRKPLEELGRATLLVMEVVADMGR